MNLLCVSAFEPELTRFRELAPSWIATAPAGIGLVECALGTAELLARHAGPDGGAALARALGGMPR